MYTLYIDFRKYILLKIVLSTISRTRITHFISFIFNEFFKHQNYEFYIIILVLRSDNF